MSLAARSLHSGFECHVCSIIAAVFQNCRLTENTCRDSCDLVSKWLDASPNVRKKHVLIGLAGACGSSLNLNQARLSCTKELRVSYCGISTLFFWLKYQCPFLVSTDGHKLFKLINALAPYYYNMTSHRYQLTRALHVSSSCLLIMLTSYPSNTSTMMSGIRCRMLVRIVKMK